MDKISIAINKWDPIGFFPMAPEDEYADEIGKIIEYIENVPGITERNLSRKINDIFIDSFGNDVYSEDMKECLRVAREIINSL